MSVIIFLNSILFLDCFPQDKSQRQGLPPGSESAPLSGPYDHK